MSDFHMRAVLECGAQVDVRQPGESQTLELTVIPIAGAKIEETAWIKDNTLRVNVTVPALLGFYQFIELMFG